MRSTFSDIKNFDNQADSILEKQKQKELDQLEASLQRRKTKKNKEVEEDE